MNRTRNIILGLTIVAAIILTFFSLFELCTKECQEGHNYHIFGMPFEWLGLLIFIPVAIMYVLAQKNQQWFTWIGLIFASALGGELVFIGFQKYVIGAWCPVCLAIAATVFIGCVTLSYSYFENLLQRKGNIMDYIWRGAGTFAALCIGFTASFVGITKVDALQAVENTIKEKIAFGDKNSDIEVYIFTDWACPACRKLDPILPMITQSASKDARVTFVDHAVHPETLNYIPFNLSFMINNKKDYFKIRQILTDISIETGTPQEEVIEERVSRIGVEYKQLDYVDVSMGIKYFKELGEKFKVKGTPTLVIINTDTKKGKKLAGTAEITEAKVQAAIEEMKGL